MAQLQWNPVDMPRLDTRDLAMAGQTVDNAFGRFADLLNARDARLNKDATDNAAAQLMAAQSPEELAALMAQGANGGFGDRASKRDVLAVGNQRQEALLQNAARQQQMDIGKEDLLNKQDMSQFGDLYRQYDQHMAGGKRDLATAVAEQIRAAGGGRNLYTVGQDGEKLYGDWRDAAERHRSALANEANAAARLGMDRQRFNLELKDRASQGAGITLSGVLADKLGAYSTDDALSLVRDMPQYKALDPIAKRAFDADFKGQHEAITKITADVAAGTSKGGALVNNKVADLREGQLTAEAPIRNDPLYRSLVQGSKPDEKITLQSMSEKLNSLDGKWLKAGTQAQITQLRNNVRGPDGNPISLEDLNAAIDNYSMKKGAFQSSDDFYATLKGAAQQVVDARATGRQQLFEQDLASLGGQYSTHAAELQNLFQQKQQLTRRKQDTSKIDTAIAASIARTHMTKADISELQRKAMNKQ